MIKTYNGGRHLSHKYVKPGQYKVLTSNNIEKWSFVGNQPNNLQNQLLEIKNINSNVIELADNCFQSCHKLKKINLQNTQIRKIGKNCFSNCSKLEEIYLPISLEYFSSECFSNNSNLQNISFEIYDKDLSQSFTAFNKIDEKTFSGCSNLKSIIIPPSINDITNLNQNALYESNINTITFLGLGQEQIKTNKYITDTYLMGLRQNCLIHLSDDALYKYTYTSNSISAIGFYELSKSGYAEGKLPSNINNVIKYKMRFGKIYRFQKNLIEWCRNEKVPFVVIYLDHLTNKISRSFCDSILSNSDLMKKMQKDPTILKFYIFLTDRKGMLNTQNEDLSFCKSEFGGMEFIQFTFEYESTIKKITYNPSTPDDFYEFLNKKSDECNFKKWNSTPYMVKFDDITPETIPTGDISQELTSAIKYKPWWS